MHRPSILDPQERDLVELESGELLGALRNALAGVTVITVAVLLFVSILLVFGALLGGVGAGAVWLVTKPWAYVVLGAVIGVAVLAVGFLFLGIAADSCLVSLGVKLNGPLVALCWILGPAIVVVCGPIAVLANVGKHSRRPGLNALVGAILLVGAAAALLVGLR